MKTCPCNIQRFFSALKIENFIGKFWLIFICLLKNIDFGYTLEPPRRGGTHNLCFGTKIRKIGIPL